MRFLTILEKEVKTVHFQEGITMTKKDYDKEAEKRVSEMTLEEKAGLLSGADFWHTKEVESADLPSCMMCDGPNGLRKQIGGKDDMLGINESIKTTCYPTSAAIAASFDPALAEDLGKHLGAECRREQVSMLLGPGINIKRSPLGGRNFEYYSEDPLAAGTMGAAYVRGLQSQHVSACPKHFALNNQEDMRMAGSSECDERTIHEIYLSAFEQVVRESDPHAIMCSYNKINGTYSSENRWLLTDVLRKRFGFDGFVVTDWLAGKDPVKGVQAGVNLVMPGVSDYQKTEIVKGVKEGTITEEEVTRAAEELVSVLLWTMEEPEEKATFTSEDDFDFAVQAAENSAVLLKNEGHVLPLKKETSVLFAGAFAKTPRTQGSGSSHINSKKVLNVLEEAKKDGLSVSYAEGYSLKEPEKNEALLKEAVEAAASADVIVVFAGLPNAYESEGFDRDSLDLPNEQNALIRALAATGKKVAVVLHNGAPVTMPWKNEVDAILEMYLAGDGCGRAEIDLLYGRANPSGKLPETFPIRIEDTPSFLNFPGDFGSPEYREGVFVGYRWYDTRKMDVLFPFGHGLSYTTFAYSNLRADRTDLTDQDTVTVSVDVTNTGDRAGAEVVQFYVKDPVSSRRRPEKELKAFRKVFLQPGETRTVSAGLNGRAFSYYEVKIHDFFVESGDFIVEAGSSSRDIRGSITLHVGGTKKIPVHFTRHSTIGEILQSPAGKQMFGAMMAGGAEDQAAKSDNSQLGEGSDRMQEQGTLQMPISAMLLMGKMTPEQLDGIVDQLNAAESESKQ